MPMVMTAMMVPVAVVVPRSAHIGRTQVDVDNACDGAEAGLTLQAQRLQRDRIVGAADQQVGADADTRRGVGAHTAEMTGKRTAANPMARRVHDPRETGFRGGAQIETEALDVRNVRLRRRTGVAAEHTLHFGGRADHVTDIGAAMAFENAGLNLLGLSARDGRNQRHGGHGEKFWEVHGIELHFLGAVRMKRRGDHDGSAVSKTRR